MQKYLESDNSNIDLSHIQDTNRYFNKEEINKINEGIEKINIIIDNTDSPTLNNSPNTISQQDSFNFHNIHLHEKGYIYQDILKDGKKPKRNRVNSEISTIDVSRKEKLNESEFLELYEEILKRIKKLKDLLYLVSVKYDNIVGKYNLLSISIIVISTFLTLIEAIKLLGVDYMTNKINNDNHDHENDDNKIDSHDYNTQVVIKYGSSKISNFIFASDILMLFFSTTIIFISSVIRFYNYREIMENLKKTQSKISNYIYLYDKQKLQLLLYRNDKEQFEVIRATIEGYYNNIKEEFNEQIQFRHTNLIKLYDIKYRDDAVLRDKKKDALLKQLQIKTDEKKKIIEIKNDLLIFKINNSLHNSNIFLNGDICYNNLYDNMSEGSEILDNTSGFSEKVLKKACSIKTPN